MAAQNDRVESALLRRINEQRLLEVIQRSGPPAPAATAATEAAWKRWRPTRRSGTLLVDCKDRFDQVLERVKQRTLTASLAECVIVPTRSSKRQGAVAGIMHRLTNAWAPAIR